MLQVPFSKHLVKPPPIRLRITVNGVLYTGRVVNVVVIISINNQQLSKDIYGKFLEKFGKPLHIVSACYVVAIPSPDVNGEQFGTRQVVNKWKKVQKQNASVEAVTV